MKSLLSRLVASGAFFLFGVGVTIQGQTPVAEAVPAPIQPAVPVAEAPAAPVAPVEAPPVVAPAPVANPEVKPTAVEVPTDASGAGPTAIQSGQNNTISIQLDAVPVDQVVRMFARAANANIVAATLPSTNVTVRLENVAWEPALAEILNSVGLALVQRKEGIYAVVTKDEMGIEPIESDIIFLNFSTTTNVLPLIATMIAGSSNSSVAAYSGANAIVVRGPASQIKQIKDIVAQIDKPRNQVMIECKFVELNDQAIKDLGINWQSLQGWTVGVVNPTLAYDKTRTTRDQRTLTDTKSDITVDTVVNQSSDISSETATRENKASATGTGGSAFTGTTPGGSTTVENNSGNATASSSALNGSSRIRSDTSAKIGGKNFSDIDPITGIVTIEPARTIIDESLDFAGTEVVKAMSAILTADTFQATLSALKQNTGVEIVSNPKIVVASGEMATIHVGRNEPNVVARPQGDTGDRYAYELDGYIEIGVKLKVTPVLNGSNNISLRITPELSRKIGEKLVAQAGTTYPITQIRKVDTQFNVESGHTVALGGLTETSDQEIVNKIPILGDIPIIGTYLFRHTHMEKTQDEVIIFVTASSAPAHSLAQVSGIPEEAKLVHRHLAKKIEEAAKAEEMAKQKAKKAALPK